MQPSGPQPVEILLTAAAAEAPEVQAEAEVQAAPAEGMFPQREVPEQLPWRITRFRWPKGRKQTWRLLMMERFLWLLFQRPEM